MECAAALQRACRLSLTMVVQAGPFLVGNLASQRPGPGGHKQPVAWGGGGGSVLSNPGGRLARGIGTSKNGAVPIFKFFEILRRFEAFQGILGTNFLAKFGKRNPIIFIFLTH